MFSHFYIYERSLQKSLKNIYKKMDLPVTFTFYLCYDSYNS